MLFHSILYNDLIMLIKQVCTPTQLNSRNDTDDSNSGFSVLESAKNSTSDSTVVFNFDKFVGPLSLSTQQINDMVNHNVADSS